MQVVYQALLFSLAFCSELELHSRNPKQDMCPFVFLCDEMKEGEVKQGHEMPEVGLKENDKFSGGSVEILSSLIGCATTE